MLPIGHALVLSAPAGTVFRPGPGDSVVAGVLAGPGFDLSVDLGVHADPLDGGEDGAPLWSRETTIDGRAGRLRLWRTVRGGVPFRLGLHVPLVAPTPFGALRLTIAGQVPDEATAARVAAMLETIRFRSI